MSKSKKGVSVKVTGISESLLGVGVKNRLTHRILEIGSNTEWGDVNPPM